MTPAGAQVSLTGGFAARIAAAVVAALDPMLAAIKIQLGIISADLDKIAASDLTVVAAVAAIKQQQSVMNGNIVTLGGALAKPA